MYGETDLINTQHGVNNKGFEGTLASYYSKRKADLNLPAGQEITDAA